MNHSDNPAGRLVLFLENALEIDDQAKMKALQKNYSNLLDMSHLLFTYLNMDRF